MTKSGISEGEVRVSCDAVFDIPAHGTFSENFSFSFFLLAILQNKSQHDGKERAAVCVPSQVATSSSSETTASHDGRRWATPFAVRRHLRDLLQSDVGY